MLVDLRAIRLESGLTLTEVAAEANIDKGHLSRLERGQDGVSLPTFARLAHILCLTKDEVNDFVRGDAHAQGQPHS